MVSLVLAACGKDAKGVRMDQATDIAWRALEPNTSSQNRRNWEMKQAQRVSGRDVVAEFTPFGLDECPIPLPPENQAIRAASEYWYVRAEPISSSKATSGAGKTGEVANPEPFLKAASFLIDPFSGQVVARKFVCGDIVKP